ncbi:hypothetical protein V6N12_042744 [Hibiscus sabdariffa]|uniref:Glutamyl-tRNA reductase N-terminal domain-containing protein n=1 Tax=Hibiscus sabdariffa TaxID=183260 RepID=A0ABR2B1C0_9ROSI
MLTKIDGYTKEMCIILSIRLSIHTAPMEMREKVSLLEVECPRSTAELGNLSHIEEWHPSFKDLRAPIFLYNKGATQHLFEVSDGLDSLVLGEGKILAQVKQVAKVIQGVVDF